MNPAIYLGPRCNHDLGVLLRFLLDKIPAVGHAVDSLDDNGGGIGQAAEVSRSSVGLEDLGQGGGRESDDVSVSDAEIQQMTERLLEELENSEFYCSSYATKEQPQIEGLMQTLSFGLKGLEQNLAEQQAQGDNIDVLEQARRVLHRLLSSTHPANA